MLASIVLVLVQREVLTNTDIFDGHIPVIPESRGLALVEGYGSSV